MSSAYKVKHQKYRNRIISLDLPKISQNIGQQPITLFYNELLQIFGYQQINFIDQNKYQFTNLQKYHLSTSMKLIAALLVLSGVATSFTVNEECPHEVEVECIDDINKAYPICEKAAEEKGKDIPADLECMKYFTQVDKDCWPCICLIAQTAGWKIKGCQ